MELPDEFPFPFPPYSIQKDFMVNLYSCLDKGNLGIFESPTGTGKSLSIICGALKWLMDYEKNYKDTLVKQLSDLNDKLKEITEESKGDWFSEQTKQRKVNVERQTVQDKLDALARRDERMNKFKETVKQDNFTKKRQWKVNSKSKNKNNCKDDDKEPEVAAKDTDDVDTDLLLDDLNLNSDSDDEETPVESLKYTQFFFCSRTHSQLTQFIGEIKKSPYSNAVSLVPLASRQNYCINKDVKKLGHVNLINDRCLQMQRKKVTVKKEKDLKRSKSSTSCPFNPGDQSLLIADIVTTIQDVEEIADGAKQLETCAYYASRRSLPDSQVVLVPYNSILHKNTRISSGIDLKNNVLIIDEAHNLLEAIENMHSSTVTGRHILHCFSQLTQYQKRFENLFSAKNVLYLSQLSFFLKKLIKVLGGTSRSQSTDKVDSSLQSAVYSIEKFETFAEIDTVNVFELLQFISSSKLIHKLRGYVEKYSGDLKVRPVVTKKSGVSAFLNALQGKESAEAEPTERQENESTCDNPLIFIISFLESLKSNSADGRIFIKPGPTVGQGSIKFLLMNPAAHFHDIVKEARSVILAGGTMEPISEFRDQLFIGAGAEPQRIVTFSCDHVIPKDNILTRIVTQGPTGIKFEFNYQNRDNKELLNELGRTLKNLCNIVPGGVVVFLPSYNYESSLYKHLEATGVIANISNKKKIFREPKLASQVNAVLESYAEAVKTPAAPQNGAILFSVVGGKLSEGLNFSDDLGRCVIVVGMPYPNIKSLELQEKMKYLNENVKAGAGNEYYENSCMKAVNQCIGRAVRHINDYSTVVLLDRRYSNKTKSLPGWIQRTLAVHNTFNNTISDVARFFSAKKKKM
ncbi:ATP-dependent DNA helicase DDX11 [Microplitis mediator]|uniref:ATP-dependent DNA helicase DDX11 n=1 Tax=Microplitis mediator TaxID=375433 RepID=UPI0025564DAA|nr:ATP-dependent DNA helicase DDX11 [Microplitis mediator]